MIRKIIDRFPFFILLLPLFFVLHGWKENFYYLTFRNVGILSLTFIAAALVLYAICLLPFKQRIKAGLFAFILLSTYFFFGAVQDFLNSYSFTKEFCQYKILLPGILLIILVAFILLKKTKRPLKRANYFLSLLLFLFIIFDLIVIISLPAVKKIKINTNGLPVQATVCDTCTRPDIYFLLFDEYASSASLKQSWNYDNSGFDSALLQRGFHLISGSRSNYNFTPFSLASILNMSYLKGITNVNACSIEDYSLCNNLILQNAVGKLLENNGYQIINYSIFDMKGEPSLVNQSFLPLKARLITEQTLFNRLKRDLGHLLYVGKFRIKWFADRLVYQSLRNNTLFLKKIMEAPGKKREKPAFIYGHFYMPHNPYYFDSSGNKTDVKFLRTVSTKQYLQYVGYTNRQILALADTILKNSSTPPVIIIMGDHGFRMPDGKNNFKNYFQNMNAIYVPGEKYDKFYDTLSGVNQFRVLFNTIFHQSIPLLKDSTIFLKDQ